MSYLTRVILLIAVCLVGCAASSTPKGLPPYIKISGIYICGNSYSYVRVYDKDFGDNAVGIRFFEEVEYVPEYIDWDADGNSSFPVKREIVRKECVVRWDDMADYQPSKHQYFRQSVRVVGISNAYSYDQIREMREEMNDGPQPVLIELGPRGGYKTAGCKSVAKYFLKSYKNQIFLIPNDAIGLEYIQASLGSEPKSTVQFSSGVFEYVEIDTPEKKHLCQDDLP